jgi:Fe-S cluster assembly ATP-binding protein
MSTLQISGLRASVVGKEILRGIDLEISSGEVHAVMGPNGSGKSTLAHVLAGRPGYEVLGGSVTLDGEELLDLPTWQRARAGLLCTLQYPVEVPGVPVTEVLREARRAAGHEGDSLELIRQEATRIGLDERFLHRAVNVEFSGGERKRTETMQLAVLGPKFAVLDELDSGLDVDALRAVSRRIEASTSEDGLGVLAITHYARLLTELRPDHVHVLLGGRIVRSGGPELANELESTGYAEFREAAAN